MIKGKYLITTDMWFMAPNGREYKAVWGEVELLQTKDVLGFDPNRNSANWFVRVGTDNNHVYVAGCQIHYCVRSEDRPNDGPTRFNYDGEGEKHGDCKIYFADDEPSKPEFPKDKSTIGFNI